jgi:hypothetical protein
MKGSFSSQHFQVIVQRFRQKEVSGSCHHQRSIRIYIPKKDIVEHVPTQIDNPPESGTKVVLSLFGYWLSNFENGSPASGAKAAINTRAFSRQNQDV